MCSGRGNPGARPGGALDGLVGPLIIEAIEGFQSAVTGIADGRVDPGAQAIGAPEQQTAGVLDELRAVTVFSLLLSHRPVEEELALFNSSRGVMHGIYRSRWVQPPDQRDGHGPAHPAVSLRVRSLCGPVLKPADDYLRIAQQTNDAATVLRQTDPARLQGVVLGQGGLGPEIGRTQQALVTSIRQLPLNGREAAQKLTGALGAITVLVRQTAARAGIIGRARLTAALLGIETALVEFGARLTTPIIIIDRRVLHQLMGVPDVDGA